MAFDMNAQPGTNGGGDDSPQPASNPWDNDPITDATSGGQQSAPWDSDPIVPTASPVKPNWLSSALGGTSKMLGGGDIPRSTESGALGVLDNTWRYAANNLASGTKNLSDAAAEDPTAVDRSNPFSVSPGTRKAVTGTMETLGAIPSALGRSLVADPTANAVGVDPNQRDWQSDDSLGMKAKKSLVDVAEDAGSMAAPTAISSGLKLAGRAVIPEANDAAKKLIAEGVAPTPGQHYDPSNFLRQSEDLTERLPYAGGLITGAKKDALGTFQDAMYNKSLNAIGDDNIPANLSGRQKVNYVEGKLNSFYDQLKPLISYDPGSTSNLGQNANQILKSQFGLNDQQKQQYIDTVTKAMQNGPMNGDQFKQLDSVLGQKGLNYYNSTNPDQQQLGEMLLDFKSAMRDDMATQNPSIAKQLDWANDGYSKFMVSQKASIRRVNSLGEFTPDDISSIMRQENSRQFSRGQAPMQDLVDAAQQQMPGSLGTNQISKGIALQTLLNQPGRVAAGLAASPLYLDKGRQVFSDIATRKPVMDRSLVMNPNYVKRGLNDAAIQEDRND